MRMISTFAAVAAPFIVFPACGPKQDPSQQAQPNMAPAASAPYGYPQQPGAYPTATAGGPAGYGYPQQGAPQPTYTAAMPAPTAAPAGSAGQMAVPGALAFQCTNDVPCGTHHCNVQYGKCAFPCQTNADCITPNACAMGLCVPQMGAAPSH